jgi:putative oxidoreductase
VRKRRTSRHHGDLPALLIRLAIGPMLITHGYNKVKGSGGLEGTTKWFDGLGLKPAWVHARLAAATEIGSGALITLGAYNPIAPAAVIGLMTTAAATDHKGKGFFIFKGGWEYVAVIGTVTAALASLGYGRFSLDHLRGRQRSGIGWALAATALGLANAGALLATSYRPDEPEEPS